MNARERGQKLIDALLCGRDDEAKKVLADKIDFSIQNRGDNAIHLAARRGNLEIIKLMKGLGADIMQKNLHGNVPMHYAAKGGFLDLVRYLKDCGATLNSHNNDGESPLHEAVKTQTMDVIEALIDLGMKPNNKNTKNGDTPLHVALRYGATEAMEGLLIKGASPGEKNKDERRPEEVAKNVAIKESLRMYSTMLIAMSSGMARLFAKISRQFDMISWEIDKYIKAKGMKITREVISDNYKVERVGTIIESIDIPKEFPTGFYCRREKAENATVTLKKFNEETIFSDVFHIRIFEVNRDCDAKIYVPVFRAPSEKEEMVIHFISPSEGEVVVDRCRTENKMNYCKLETVLIPETTFICIVNVRAKREENRVTDDAATITSEMEKDFSIEVPQGSFEGETVLSLTVYESNADDFAELEDTDREETNLEREISKTPPVGSNKSTAESEKNEHSETDANKPENPNLITDVYQINVKGQQPRKGIKVQIPLCKGMGTEDEVAVLAADENNLDKDDTLEVLQTAPKIVGCNLIFEVSHFSIYVASWKKKAESKEDRRELQRQISSAREKRRHASLFAVVKHLEGLKHILVVSCVVANKSSDCRRKWIDSEGYEEQNPPEAGPISMTPGDTYCVDLEGNASLEDKDDAVERKIQFSQCRSSWQPYNLYLHENIYEQEKAFAHVVVSKVTETGLVKATQLRIKLTAPPKPPTPPPSPRLTAESDEKKIRDKLSQLGRPDYSAPKGAVARMLGFFGKK